MRSVKENTRRLLFCGVTFAVGVSLLFYVITKFLLMPPLMRASFTGWALIFVACVLMASCFVYGALGIGFGFRHSDTLTEGDGKVVWRFGFDTTMGGRENRFVVLRNNTGLWILSSPRNR